MSTNNSIFSNSKADTATTRSSSGVRQISPQKREFIRKESESIMMKNIVLREKAKEDMFEKRVQHEKLASYSREKRLERWREKMKHSPFAVNLVAEEERISEENAIRMKDEADRRRKMETRKEKAKNEIILKV